MKTKSVFSCQNCGYQSAKWLGRCPDCATWNSFVEETTLPQVEKPRERVGFHAASPVLLKDVEAREDQRVKTGISELDRVLGGGIVPGSVVLIGGDPGVGKSTIALEVSNRFAKQHKKVFYVSGEESVAQTKLRAKRLGDAGSQGELYIVNQTDLSLILEQITKLAPDLVVIDSIQVLFDPTISSAPGSVSQVRECAGSLTQLAKAAGVSLLIIGHVTKEGSLAGPRVLEHMVDTVLYFEGDRFSLYRILRAVKNRFGSTNEIGVFEMAAAGLQEVKNPSELFLAERPRGVPGSVVTAVVEGTRPILVEIQALISRTTFGYPRRRAQGYDDNRLALLVAVLEKRLGFRLETEDIFVNVAGGMKIDDPGADLAVVCAVASAFREKPAIADVVVLGEVGLAGEVRSIPQISPRLSEAGKLGFKHGILPQNNFKNLHFSRDAFQLLPVHSVQEMLDKAIEQ